MKRTHRLLIVVGILLVAALLAFLVRDMIYNAVVVPAAFLGWGLKILYRSMAQAVWWWLSFVLVFFMLIFSLLPRGEPKQRRETRSKPRRGPVEDFAVWLGRAKGGVYFKWLIANRLGRLAYQILLHRESGRPRSVFDPLLGRDWEPSPELRNYLEIGLHGSFSDFSHPKHRLIGQEPRTPLDYEVREAVAFLESQVENSSDRTGPSRSTPDRG